MGLDWNPASKPRPGHETEYWRLFEELGQQSCPDIESKQRRFHEISISAFDTLNAPRIGIDAEATAWARAQHAERQVDVPINEWLSGLHGLYVVELVSCDGVPRYSNGSIGGYVEPYSFRAQFLTDGEYILGTDLLQEAWGNMRPAELHDYGQALRDKAVTYAREHNIDLSTVHEADDPDTVQFHLDAIIAASRWCLFWSAAGHPLEAYW